MSRRHSFPIERWEVQARATDADAVDAHNKRLRGQRGRIP